MLAGKAKGIDIGLREPPIARGGFGGAHLVDSFPVGSAGTVFTGTKPPKPPKRPGAKPPKPGAGGNLTWNAWDRPAYKHKEIDGKNVCRNWLWGGCSDACSHTKYNSREPAPLTHKCSYCQGDHRLTECDLFKAEQPADFAKGKSG